MKQARENLSSMAMGFALAPMLMSDHPMKYLYLTAVALWSVLVLVELFRSQP